MEQQGISMNWALFDSGTGKNQDIIERCDEWQRMWSAI
jgi:hypothetical protein